MDFNTLISVAQKNEAKKQVVPCYQTKFSSTKKQTKQSATISENIKKFLARKEEEERNKALEEKRKRDNLLALRDHKAQSRINKHLKVCKAANKSVIADADDHTIDIMAGCRSDIDDYGYESQAASAMYNQLMNKYNSSVKPIVNNNEKKIVKDIASTKNRIKEALKQQELEKNSGHRRKKKSSVLNEKEIQFDRKIENIDDKITEEEKNNKLKKPEKKTLPPPMDYTELLKLAEKKQFEPVIMPIKPKLDKVRPMTKRQKKEWEYMQEKEKRDQEKMNLEVTKKTSNPNMSSTSNCTQLNKNSIDKILDKSVNSIQNKNFLKDIVSSSKKINNESNNKHGTEKIQDTCKDDLELERKKLEVERKHLEEMRRSIEEEKRKLAQTKNKEANIKSSDLITAKSKIVDKLTLSKDIKSRLPSDNLKSFSLLSSNKSKQSPLDVKSAKSEQVSKSHRFDRKRRIYDDDDECDSDLNDFIDDEADENQEDYSKHISEIFGYDKNKYKHIDEDDDTIMESNFAQQLKEEYVSTKIGIMEDLEDMRMEALEKKRKTLLKEKIKK